MARPDHTPDRLQSDQDESYRLYQLLAAKVPPGQGDGGRRPPPASRPPLSIDPVSLMAELTDFLPNWNSRARWLLDPWKRIDVTARTGARCPYCDGKLISWMRPENEGASYITCEDGHLDTMGPNYWVSADWPRLGVMTGVHIDARFGPRLRSVGDA